MERLPTLHKTVPATELPSHISFGAADVNGTLYLCTGTGRYQSFQEGYRLIRSTIQQEKYQYLFQCAKSSIDFEAFMKLAG